MKPYQVTLVIGFESLLVLEAVQDLTKRNMISRVLDVIIKVCVLQLDRVGLELVQVVWLQWFGEQVLTHVHGVGGGREVFALLEL